MTIGPSALEPTPIPIDPPCCADLWERVEAVKKNFLILTVIVIAVGLIGVWGLIHGFVVSDRVECQTEQTNVLITQISRERSDDIDVDTKNAAAATQQLVAINTYLDPTTTADQKSVAVDSYAKDLSAAHDASLVAAQHRTEDQIPTVNCQ